MLGAVLVRGGVVGRTRSRAEPHDVTFTECHCLCHVHRQGAQRTRLSWFRCISAFLRLPFVMTFKRSLTGYDCKISLLHVLRARTQPGDAYCWPATQILV